MARPWPALTMLAAGRGPDRLPADGGGLVASALDHGMQGLLWAHVRDHAPDFPERVRLGGIALVARRRHEQLWAATTAVRDRLTTIGIEVLALKGVGAEARWYGGMGERPSTDVDVLVEPAGMARAGEVLRDLDPRHPLGDAIGDLVAAGGVQAADLHLGGVAVDVHFDLLKLGYPMRDPEALWARARTLGCPDGSTVRVLGPEHALVHFLVHANKDSFPRLIGFADVARVLRDPDLDWDVVARFVEREGLGEVVACSLAAVAQTLDLPAPPALATPGVRTRVWRGVWPQRTMLLGNAGPSRSRRQEALPFLVEGRVVDAVRAAARTVLPPPRAVAERYADLPGPYPVRLTRGRLRTRRDRRAALGARTDAARAPSGATVDATTKAALLRGRLAHEPLWLSVAGRSMGRSVPGGTRVRVVAAPVPRSGEVWAFCDAGGRLVVHRSRGRVPGGHRFQGDACIRPDAAVPSAHLVGRVVELDPPRPPILWGAAAGWARRVPRQVVAAGVLAGRRIRGHAR